MGHHDIKPRASSASFDTARAPTVRLRPRRAAVAIFALAACTAAPPAPSLEFGEEIQLARVPGQDEAEALVWRDLYGMDAPPPPVEWVPWEGDRPLPECGMCTGYTVPGWRIRVALADKPAPIAGSAFTHELVHWRLWLLTGDADAGHAHPFWEWQYPELRWLSRPVEEARQALAWLGL